MLHFLQKGDFSDESAGLDGGLALADGLDGEFFAGGSVDAFSDGAVVAGAEDAGIDVVFAFDVGESAGDGLVVVCFDDDALLVVLVVVVVVAFGGGGLGIAGLLLLLLMGLGIVGVAIAVVAKDGWKEEGRRCIILIILDAVPMTII